MDNKKIKLNLGCGIVYKPGYVNIDKYNSSVADVRQAVDELSYEDNSVDEIVAEQLIEHFDYIRCKYVLSEWFRVLKPLGILAIETPDLIKSFEKFRKSDLEKKITTLQWIYGIDSSGMGHKTGFGFELMKRLLQEIGFEDIERKEAITHSYEPGMRVVCRKPEKGGDRQFLSCFRKALAKEIGKGDSNLLINLEKSCIKEIAEIYLKEFKADRKKALHKIIATGAVFNPVVSFIFCNECRKKGIFENKELARETELVEYLKGIRFHQRLPVLWERRSKTAGNSAADFENFFQKQLSSIISIVESKSDYREQLKYIENLEAGKAEFFNLYSVNLEAAVLLNRGVKEFTKGNNEGALKLFSKSIKLNPDNPAAYWNSARLLLLMEKKVEAMQYYDSALSLEKDNEKRKILKEEIEKIKSNSGELPKEPVASSN